MRIYMVSTLSIHRVKGHAFVTGRMTNREISAIRHERNPSGGSVLWENGRARSKSARNDLFASSRICLRVVLLSSVLTCAPICLHISIVLTRSRGLMSDSVLMWATRHFCFLSVWFWRVSKHMHANEDPPVRLSTSTMQLSFLVNVKYARIN